MLLCKIHERATVLPKSDKVQIDVYGLTPETLKNLRQGQTKTVTFEQLRADYPTLLPKGVGPENIRVFRLHLPGDKQQQYMQIEYGRHEAVQAIPECFLVTGSGSWWCDTLRTLEQKPSQSESLQILESCASLSSSPWSPVFYHSSPPRDIRKTVPSSSASSLPAWPVERDVLDTTGLDSSKSSHSAPSDIHTESSSWLPKGEITGTSSPKGPYRTL